MVKSKQIRLISSSFPSYSSLSSTIVLSTLLIILLAFATLGVPNHYYHTAIAFKPTLSNQSQAVPSIPKPPLTIQTERGTYYIVLLWEPQPIETGKDTRFGVVFKDNSQTTITDVSYSFKVTDSSGKVIKDVKDQKAPDGTGIQTVKFEQPGPASILVSVDAVAGQPSGEFIESAHFLFIVS